MGQSLYAEHFFGASFTDDELDELLGRQMDDDDYSNDDLGDLVQSKINELEYNELLELDWHGDVYAGYGGTSIQVKGTDQTFYCGAPDLIERRAGSDFFAGQEALRHVLEELEIPVERICVGWYVSVTRG